MLARPETRSGQATLLLADLLGARFVACVLAVDAAFADEGRPLVL